MKLIINNSSMVPIYEQLVEQIKGMIVKGDLAADTILPSVRGLSRELKISALTVKKAYDALEGDGLVVTVHGKGPYVAHSNPNLLRVQQTRVVEKVLAVAVERGTLYGLKPEELRELFEMIVEGE